jgi:hypothetical protein
MERKWNVVETYRQSLLPFFKEIATHTDQTIKESGPGLSVVTRPLSCGNGKIVS